MVHAGLPSGTAWNVTIDSENYTSTTNTIALAMPDGEISYAVTSSSATYAPVSSHGTVFMNGIYTEVKVLFSPVNYTFEFAKNGLPSGTPWTATLNGVQESSTSNIYFNFTNGTYTYDISPVSGYTISSGTYSGTVTVSGSTQIISKVWSQSRSVITFVQNGLSSGYWYVNITGQPSSGKIASSSPYTISLPNGTYSYTVSASNKAYIASDSSFTLDGSQSTQTVTFSPVNYGVKFSETGLPAGTSWSVIIGGSAHTSSSSSITVMLQNGSYKYTIALSNHKYSSYPNTSELTLNVKSTIEAVTFSEVRYTLTIHETGLSNGTSWNLSIDGVMYTSTSAYLNVSVSNGTEIISASSSGYSSSATCNSTSVSGANETFNVSFARETNSTPSSLVYLGSAGIIGSAVVISSVIFLRIRRH